MNKFGKNLIGAMEASKLVGITLNQLENWVRKKVVDPYMQTDGHRFIKRFSPEEIEKLKKVKYYIDEDYTFKKAIQKTEEYLHCIEMAVTHP